MPRKILVALLASTQNLCDVSCVSAEPQVSDLHPRSTSAGPHYRFKDGIWDVVAELKAWPSITAAAKELGVSDTTLSRAIKGETAPGEVLMARLMWSLPRTWKHEHVFDLAVPEQVATRVPA